MPFVARCPFCHLKVRKVPSDRLGNPAICTRCNTRFMLDPLPGSLEPAAGETSAGEAAASAGGAKEPLTVSRLLKDQFQQQQAAAAEEPAAPAEQLATPVLDSRPRNFAGVTSFVLASFAAFAAAVFHNGLITFVLGLLALGLGVAGLLVVRKLPGVVLPAVGIAISILAILLPAFRPRWIGVSPVWNRDRPFNRQAEAVVAMSPSGEVRRATSGETGWVDASQNAIIHGDVRLRVRSATVGAVEFKENSGQRPPRDRCLVIGLRITNAGITRRVRYVPWDTGPDSAEKVILVDSQGKKVAGKMFAGPWVVKGRATSASIPPGKYLDDVLVFEAPPDTIDYLRLDLAASAASGEGRFRFEIPKQMIHFR